MARRYLIGPVTGQFADDHLGPARRARTCLTFGSRGADIPFQPGDTCAALLGRLPPDWAPDIFLLHLAYTVLPLGFPALPQPIVGYAPDWPLHWHYYRELATHVDQLWTDARGAELLATAGVGHVRPVVPFGRPASISATAVHNPRDIDLVWVGNFNPAIHHDRLPWVTRIARLGLRYRVRIVPGLDPQTVRPLLARARVAFLPAFHGGWDTLVAEAFAAGAVVIRDRSASEFPGGLVPGRDYLTFTDTDLEAIVESVLGDDTHRATLATAGHARSAVLASDSLWANAQEQVEQEWGDLVVSAQQRCARCHPLSWEARAWQSLTTRTTILSSGPGGAEHPAGAATESLLSAVLAAHLPPKRGGAPRPAAVKQLRSLRGDLDVGGLAALHLAELLATGRPRDAVPLLRQCPATAVGRELPPSLTWGVGLLRPGFDSFRVEWERAGWAHAGDPAAEKLAKQALLRSRYDLLRGRCLDDPARLVRAAATAPRFLTASKAAARAVARIGTPDQAAPYFDHALAADPFDARLAQEYADFLDRAGDRTRRDQLAQDRQLLDRALPRPNVPATPVRAQRVSLTMIVRDEEANIAACLDSAQGLVDEVIVVDTGSTDRTPELVAARGGRIIPFAWRDDFAAARNAGVDAASGQWIFWLDADEQLGPAARDKARRLFSGLREENAAYMMRQLSPSADPTGATTAVDQVRLFRNRPEVRWEYRIHEQILLAIRRTRASVRATDIVIDHRGYWEAGLRSRKLQRNTRLLEMAHAERLEDPILAFNLAWVYHKGGRPAEALPLLELCRRVLLPHVSIVPKVYRLLAQVLDRLGRMDEAMVVFADGRRLFPNDLELLLHHGLLLQRRKDYSAAELCFQRILVLPPGSYPVGLDLGLRGYKTRNALAELFHEQGLRAKAEAEWRVVLAEQPNFAPAWVGLAEIAAAEGRDQDARAILGRARPSDPVTRGRLGRLRRALQTADAPETIPAGARSSAGPNPDR